jgi:hypothetical protein
MKIAHVTGKLIRTKPLGVRTINLQETLETNVTTVETTGAQTGIKKQQ